MTATAYVDESYRQPSPGSPGRFSVAAVIVDDHHAESTRDALRALCRPQQRRLHWSKESHRSRLRLVEAIDALGHVAVVVTVHPVNPIEQLEARTLAMPRLLAELAPHIDALVIERGDHHVEAIDNAAIASLPGLQGRASHEGPLTEPLLWLPDIVVGAATARLPMTTPALIEISFS